MPETATTLPVKAQNNKMPSGKAAPHPPFEKLRQEVDRFFDVVRPLGWTKGLHVRLPSLGGSWALHPAGTERRSEDTRGAPR